MINQKDIIAFIAKSDIDIDLSTIKPDVDLLKQGLDSLDMATVLFELEDAFSISVPDEDIDSGKLSSIDKIVSYINDKS